MFSWQGIPWKMLPRRRYLSIWRYSQWSTNHCMLSSVKQTGTKKSQLTSCLLYKSKPDTALLWFTLPQRLTLQHFFMFTTCSKTSFAPDWRESRSAPVSFNTSASDYDDDELNADVHNLKLKITNALKKKQRKMGKLAGKIKRLQKNYCTTPTVEDMYNL